MAVRIGHHWGGRFLDCQIDSIMSQAPNILLFLMDAAQASAFEPGSPCLTPNFDRLRRRGLTFDRCYAPSPTCSPSRASFMTGLYAHNHGVLEVEHGRDPDQCLLRTEHPHFAQHLAEAGYQTGFFGKWHIERTNQVADFGWQTSVVKGAEHHANLGKGQDGGAASADPHLCGYLEQPDGYKKLLHWGVTDVPPEERYPHFTVGCGLDFIANADAGSPWCAACSFSEPNETLILSRSTFGRYDPQSMPMPSNFNDDLSLRPNIYKRQRLIASGLNEEHWRMARTCYFGRITELDDQFGRLLDHLEASGEIENTVIVVSADHGRYVGAHGFDAHNFGGFEEIYRVPLIVAGPGITAGTCRATVNLHDLCPTLCELGQAKAIWSPDSKSLLPQMRDPNTDAGIAYSENHGTRYRLTQRVLWDGPWKFVFNGFDFDELYDLDSDPDESVNLAGEPEHQERCRSMMKAVWDRVRDTGDRTLLETHYFSMRLGIVGPEWQSP